MSSADWVNFANRIAPTVIATITPIAIITVELYASPRSLPRIAARRDATKVRTACPTAASSICFSFD